MAALVVLLVVVALTIWAVVALRGGSADETENAAATSPLETTQAEETTEPSGASGTEETTEKSTSDPKASESGTESAAASGTKTGTESEEPTDEAQLKDTCELQDLVITANSNQPNYASGDQPELFMTVQNPTAADCEINLEDQVLRFEVYNLASNARIWSDVDCNPAVETDTRVFPAGEERYFQATWSRTTSSPDQCSNREMVPAGSYFLHTVIGNNPSPALTFNLN